MRSSGYARNEQGAAAKRRSDRAVTLRLACERDDREPLMPQRTARVLVVSKKDLYQTAIHEQRDAHLLRLLRKRHPDVVEMRTAHVVHTHTLEAVIETLRSLPVTFELAYRAASLPASTALNSSPRYDLVISVGGDGTFLQAAHVVSDSPILGVNSDPRRSEAVFCAATRQTFPRLCRLALAGALPEQRLYRLAVKLNGRLVYPPAVNDALVVHDDPATVSRYRLQIGSRRELQKSSGVWVSTAAGSSSAILAAGGQRLPWDAKRFQYRPRELYQGRLSGGRLTGGLLPPRRRVQMTWLMRRGSVFIDGPHARIPLRFADELELTLSLSNPVRVFSAPARAVPTG